ncbi:MAG: hypothetical protein WBK26_16020 [Burkholderiaceae bacterium]|jgi:hypothetical protein
MTASEMLATAAHLHVAMRRKMGRVTDVEWMASNPAYAEAMTRLAADHAATQGDEDLLKWAHKLAQAWADLAPPAPRAPRLTATPAAEAPTERYVVGLRC